MQVPDQIPEDLLWLAVQFVLNELSDEETRAFESRLEQDELACLAVSRAVQISTAMRQTCEEFHAGSAGGEIKATDVESRHAGPGQSVPRDAVPVRSLSEREILAERLRAQVAADRAKSVVHQQRVRKLSFLLACGIVCAAVIASIQQSGWLDRDSRHMAERAPRPRLNGSSAARSSSEDTAGLLGMYAEGQLESGTTTVSDSVAILDSATVIDIDVPLANGGDLTDLSEIDVPDWLFTAIELEVINRHEQPNGGSSEPDGDSPPDEIPGSEVL